METTLTSASDQAVRASAHWPKLVRIHAPSVERSISTAVMLLMGRKVPMLYSLINNLLSMFILESRLSSQHPPCCLCGDGRPPIFLCALMENQKGISRSPWHTVPLHTLPLGRWWSLIQRDVDSPVITEHTCVNNHSLPAASVCNG